MNFERIFARNLAQRLSEKIYGKIVVKVNGDNLEVYIDCWTDISCTITIYDFTNKILNGYSTDYCCYEVLERYKRILMKRYFKPIKTEEAH